jgi:hypothetical protein
MSPPKKAKTLEDRWGKAKPGWQRMDEDEPDSKADEDDASKNETNCRFQH